MPYDQLFITVYIFYSTTYGCEDLQIEEKNYWLWKWTLGTDQQEHLEKKRLELK
jgi:hypothetical protein